MDLISLLLMDLFHPFVQAVFLLNKKRQIVLISPGLRVIIIFPDKACALAVFRDRPIAHHLTKLIRRIHIKQKDTARVEIIVGKSKNRCQIFFCQHIIHTITDADDRPDRSV